MFDETPNDDWGGQSWRLVDPRPSLEANPYTFFVPSRAEIETILPGEPVKLIFAQDNEDTRPVERMWVEYKGRDEKGWFGVLANEPFELTGLNVGDMIRFASHHIIGVMDCKVDDMGDEDRFFARAYVDSRVLDGSCNIGMMERKKRWRMPWNRSSYGDTGWHIFAEGHDGAGAADMQYVAIGLVLNRDDAMLPLLEASYGTRLQPLEGRYICVQ